MSVLLPAENLLGQETSPYLLQHKDNPVHWRSWGAEAFDEAKELDKPILLSIGYAACHWCHVMAHESFENDFIANLMNQFFVNIKVDREERPDVDTIYMTALSMMGQQGGWPLTMFMTPDRQPFWGGTYFPPEARVGHPGFADILSSISMLYREQKEKIMGDVKTVEENLQRMSVVAPPSSPSLSSIDDVTDIARISMGMIDMVHGGMSGAPKFPQPSLFYMLWRSSIRSHDPKLKEAVVFSLTQMCQGGIYDHLGGGFARYSTDVRWLAPHFEKMLYDNAQLIGLLTSVYAETKKPLFKMRITETVEWCLRDLQTDKGGFAGSLDADSLDSEGHFQEGAYYVWQAAEIDDLLGDNTGFFKDYYDVSDHGNWEKTNILNRLGRTEDAGEPTEARLAGYRAALLKARESRPPPGLDDKILTDWNGMMIAALAQAGSYFDKPGWIDAAEKAYKFIQTYMQVGTRLCHSWRTGIASRADVLDDYAMMIQASLALLQATSQSRYLTDAENWFQELNNRYYDNNSGGGYFFSPVDANDLITRTRYAFDNATPAGNGVMVENLARLYHLTGNDLYRRRAEQLVRAFSPLPPQQLLNMASLLNGFEILVAAKQVVLIASEKEEGDLARTAIEHGGPTLVFTCINPASSLPDNHPASGKTMIDDQPTAYVCSGKTCGLPLTDAASLKRELSGE